MKSLFPTLQPINPVETPIILQNEDVTIPYIIEDKDRIVQHQNEDYLFLLPERTGTRSIYLLLSYLNLITPLPKNWIPNHNPMPDNYTGKVVVSVRHPLDRFISGYAIARFRFADITLDHMFSSIGNTNKEIFPGHKWKETSVITNLLGDRSPDYVIRLESIEQDLIKLPFINDVSALPHVNEPLSLEERLDIRNQIILNREWAEKLNTVFYSDFINFDYETI